jgi:autophagy-related protein 16
LFVTAGNDKKLKLYDMEGTYKFNLSGCMSGVMYAQFNASDEYVLGASNDNSVRIWSLETGRTKVLSLTLLLLDNIL